MAVKRANVIPALFNATSSTDRKYFSLVLGKDFPSFLRVLVSIPQKMKSNEHLLKNLKNGIVQNRTIIEVLCTVQYNIFVAILEIVVLNEIGLASGSRLIANIKRNSHLLRNKFNSFSIGSISFGNGKEIYLIDFNGPIFF